jgi:GNAT superfamily N-acetyltransferase
MSAATLDIRLLDVRAHERSTFACGVPALEEYLKQHANRHGEQGISATYIATATGASPPAPIIGYYTLSACILDLAALQTALPPAQAKKLPRFPEIPATLLGRLAVATSHRKQGYGEILLMDALRRGKRVAKEVGSFALVVEAKDAVAGEFYAHYGFISLTALHRFLPFASVP